jgi:hypothetical protein
MRLSLRKTWPDGENDYVILADGKKVGRMYEEIDSLNRSLWIWSLTGFGPQYGSMRGNALSQEQAKQDCKRAIERILASGILPRRASVSA